VKNTEFLKQTHYHLVKLILLYFSADFIFNFEMNHYPFDVQVYYLNITLTGKQLVTNRYLFKDKYNFYENSDSIYGHPQNVWPQNLRVHNI